MVSSRRRLCETVGRPIGDAPALLREQVLAAAESGVEFFQVREPDLTVTALLQLSRLLAEASRGRVRIVINDRADVAAACGASLHLKVSSMPVSQLRPWLPAGTWISAAVHEFEDLAHAEGADALIVGTVKDTPSKALGTPRLGFDGLARLAVAAGAPVFAIGGMTAADWPAVAATGAAGLASIGWMLPRGDETPGRAVVRAMSDLRAVVDAGRHVS